MTIPVVCPRYLDTPATICHSTNCSLSPALLTTYDPGFHPHHGHNIPIEDRAIPNTVTPPRAWPYTLVSLILDFLYSISHSPHLSFSDGNPDHSYDTYDPFMSLYGSVWGNLASSTSLPPPLRRLCCTHRKRHLLPLRPMPLPALAPLAEAPSLSRATCSYA